MSIPANITSELAALEAQVAAAAPLTSASQPTILAIVLNMHRLISDIYTALTPPASDLDTWTAPADPGLIVSGVLSLLATATDQAALAGILGYVGRAHINFHLNFQGMLGQVT